MNDQTAASVWQRAEQAVVGGDAEALERLMRDHEHVFRSTQPQSSFSGGLRPDYDAGDARAIIASTHHVKSWDDFEALRAAMRDSNSAVAQFENAADAIVGGDVATLTELLRKNRDLIRVRSTRIHHSTLLHYVGANGVEAFRQRTPSNAIEILETLLKVGADVDAVADMYDGSTTLGLVATSIHPKLAGLQDKLIAVLLEHGARMGDGAGGRAGGVAYPIVNACLANRRPEAATYLVSRGAPLDLEGAAGIGALDIVKSFFAADGTMVNQATQAQMDAGFSWACEYGHVDVVRFLLDRGMDVGARLRPHRQTGLHWAATGCHHELIDFLLERHAPLDVPDETFGGTALGWALFHWATLPKEKTAQYYDVVTRLMRAGAKVDWEWLAKRPHIMEPLRADSRMLAALQGRPT